MAERSRGEGVLKSLLSRFRSKDCRECDHRDEAYYEKLLHPESQSKRDFGAYNIRVVVMKEEKLIYDSDAVSKKETLHELCDSGHNSLCSSAKSLQLCKSTSVSSSLVDRPTDRLTSSGVVSSTSSLPASYRGCAHRNGMASDIAVYTELMFGAVGGKRKERQTKIHFIKSINQLLITKVFYPQRQSQPMCPLYDNSYEYSDFVRSANVSSSQRQSKIRSYSLNIPRTTRESVSPSPPYSGRSSPSTSYRTQGLVNPVMPPSTSVSKKSRLKGPKYAVGVVFKINQGLNSAEEQKAQRQLEDFIFSHFPIIDWRMSALKMSVEESRAHNERCKLIFDLNLAKEHFVNDLHNLYSVSRIQKPVFLTILRNPDARRTTMSMFLSELLNAVMLIDTKETDYFLSRVITSVLIHHVGWVQAFCNHMIAGGQGVDGSHSLSAPSHNPQMDQFWGLYGSMNTPGRVCRTVVCGQSKVDVCRVLYILTYFIRCKDLVRESAGEEDLDGFYRPRFGAVSTSESPFGPRHVSDVTGFDSGERRHPSTSSSLSDLPCHHDLSSGYCDFHKCVLPERSTPERDVDSSKTRSNGGLLRQNSSEECRSRVSSDSGMGCIDRNGLQYSQCDTPVDGTSISSDQLSEVSLQPSWEDLDPEKSIVLSRFRLALHDVSIEGERQHLKDGGYQFEKIKAHRFDPDHFSLRRLNAIDQQFANSLFAGFSERYLSDFVMHGTRQPVEGFRMELIRDLESVLDCADNNGRTNTAMCIIADTSTWLCERVTVWRLSTDSDTVEYRCSPTPQNSAACVKKVLRSTKELHDLGCPAEFCVLQLENMLKDICRKGELVAQFIAENSKKSLSCLLQDMDTTFCMNASDRELMLAIASAQDRTIEQLLSSEGMDVCYI